MVHHMFGVVLVVVFLLDLVLLAGVLIGPVVAIIVRHRRHGTHPRAS